MKTYVKLTLATLVIALLVSTISAQDKSSPAKSRSAETISVQTITVTGVGKEMVMPDKALLVFPVIGKGDDIDDAMEEYNKHFSKVQKPLKEAGFKKDQIRQTELMISSETTYTPQGTYKMQPVVKTHLKVAVEIDSKDLMGSVETIGSLLQSVLKEGVYQKNNTPNIYGQIQPATGPFLEMEISEKIEKAEKGCYKKALSDARDIAETLSSGRKIARIQEIKETYRTTTQKVSITQAPVTYNPYTGLPNPVGTTLKEQEVRVELSITFVLED